MAFSSNTIKLMLAGAIAAAVAMVFALDPATSSCFPRCVFHSLTGLLCPGCGGTRAMHQLLHGHVREAFRLNAMLFVFLPFTAAAAARPRWLEKPSVGWAAVWLLIAWGVGRNLFHL